MKLDPDRPLGLHHRRLGFLQHSPILRRDEYDTRRLLYPLTLDLLNSCRSTRQFPVRAPISTPPGFAAKWEALPDSVSSGIFPVRGCAAPYFRLPTAILCSFGIIQGRVCAWRLFSFPLGDGLVGRLERATCYEEDPRSPAHQCRFAGASICTYTYIMPYGGFRNQLANPFCIHHAPSSSVSQPTLHVKDRANGQTTLIMPLSAGIHHAWDGPLT
jgi:hypothetical protein